MRADRFLPFALLVAASVAFLPLVYALVARASAPPPIAMSAGFLSMGLAWSAGCSLADRRKGTVRLIALGGALLPLLALLPGFPVAFAGWERVVLVLCSVLCAAGLALLARRWGLFRVSAGP